MVKNILIEVYLFKFDFPIKYEVANFLV